MKENERKLLKNSDLKKKERKSSNHKEKTLQKKEVQNILKIRNINKETGNNK